MALKFKGATAKELASVFRSAGAEAKADGMAELLNQTKLMMALSIKQTPVDHGDLEAAHHIETRANQSDKRTYDIVVGGDVGGRNVDDYAMAIHEGQGTTWFKLGPKSIAKQAGQAEVVGGKFLERAFLTRQNPLIDAIYNAVFSRMTKDVSE